MATNTAVIPAQAGIQLHHRVMDKRWVLPPGQNWIPACAGMTDEMM